MSTHHDQKWEKPAEPLSTSWYDRRADQLAATYEAITAEEAHPELFSWIRARDPLRVLDVGCGSGRDAVALARFGSEVTAVDPSIAMLSAAKRLHPDAPVRWQEDQLPRLASVGGQFGLILLSAVWMHVEPREHEASVRRLAELTAPGGRVYATLRIGPAESARGLFAITPAEMEATAGSTGFGLEHLGFRADLLGRAQVTRHTVALHRLSEWSALA